MNLVDQNIRAMTPFTILLTRRLLFPIILVLIQRRCLTEDTACCFFFFFAKASFCAVTHAASIAPLGPLYTHKYTISERTHHTRPLTPHPIKPYTDLHTHTHTHTVELHQLGEDRFHIKSPTRIPDSGISGPPLVLFLLRETRLRGRREQWSNLTVTRGGERQKQPEIEKSWGKK